jgi:predicted membrane protein
LALTGGRIVDKLKLMLTQLIEKIIPRLIFWVAVISWISTITPILAAAFSVNTLDCLGWFILLVYFVIIPYTLLSIIYLEIKNIEEQKKWLIEYRRGKK